MAVSVSLVSIDQMHCASTWFARMNFFFTFFFEKLSEIESEINGFGNNIRLDAAIVHTAHFIIVIIILYSYIRFNNNNNYELIYFHFDLV